MTNPCPCQLVVNDTPTGSTTDSSIPSLRDDDSADESIEPISTNNQATDKYEDLTSLYPLVRQSKSVSTIRRRYKRPSWATIGRRPSILVKKRPAWVTIG